MRQTTHNRILASSFPRPEGGPTFGARDASTKLPATGLSAWQSNGGPRRGHPAKSLPFTLEASLPEADGALFRVHLLGVFALFADREAESPGTLGASLQLVNGSDTVFRHELLNGQHYTNSVEPSSINRSLGDGSSIRSVGHVEIGDVSHRVDLLSFDVPASTMAKTMRFKDLGSPASFLIFDVMFEFEPQKGCPFSSKGGGIALGEIGSIVRLGDRVKFGRALSQLESSILTAEDLDEARGQSLTFLAIVTAAMLELGGGRELHLQQLEAAREFEHLDSVEAICERAKHRVELVAEPMFKESQGPSSHLVDRALAYVERNFARDLSDASVAAQLGLSTSHFRFLFKEATGQPFHRFLVALRLEKARRILIEQELPVSAVARAVGFTGLSHFSRAFTQRFSVSPTNVRRNIDA